MSILPLASAYAQAMATPARCICGDQSLPRSVDPTDRNHGRAWHVCGTCGIEWMEEW